MSDSIEMAAQKLRDYLLIETSVTLDDSPANLQRKLAEAADNPINWEDSRELAVLANLDPGVFRKVMDRARKFDAPESESARLQASFVSPASRALIPTLPPDAREPEDPLTRGATLAVLGGLTSFAIVPALDPGIRSGSTDEIMAVGFGAAIGLLGSIKRSPEACGEAVFADDAWETLKGGGAGLGAGVGLASLTQAALFSVVDGGILLGGMLIGGAASYVYRKTKKKKHCPGLRGVRHLGDCSQRVCRKCFALFVPDPRMETLDCRNRRILNWYQVASYLQYQGLSYLDSVILVKENLGQWKTLYDSDRSLLISCESFIKWIDENPSRLANYINSGRRFGSLQEADAELRREGL